MKNGKRIEFNGAAKIVILAIVMLMITGITAIEAAAYDINNCPKCPDSGLTFSSAESWEGKDALGCLYYGSIEDGYSGNIQVNEYNSAKQATSDFERMRKYRNPNREITTLKDSGIESVSIAHDLTSPDIEILGYFLDIEKQVVTNVRMKVDVPYDINDSDIAEAKTRFQALAKCAHTMTGWKNVPVLSETKEEATLTLRHYPPYYKPGKNDPRRAGDLLATLTDENDNGVSGKQIFFYVKSGTDLNKVLVHRMVDLMIEDDVNVFKNYIRPKTGGYYIGHGYANEDGKAYSQYLSCVRPEILSEIIRSTGKSVKGRIAAVVFDPETNKIGKKASVDIELSGVAKITRISIYDLPENVASEKRRILLRKVNEEPIFVYDKDCCDKGYDLLYGDVISLDKNDYVELEWPTGLKLSIKTKPHVLEEDMADVTIGKTGLEHQLSRDMYELRQDAWVCTIALSGAGLILGIYALPATTAGIATYTALGVGATSLVIGLEGKCFGEVPYIITRLKSKILVDPTSSGVTFYTIEGSNELITSKGSKREVTTGRKISVLPDGTFSQVSEFDRSELNDGLSYLLDEIEGKPHKPRPTSAPVSTSTPIPTPKSTTPVRRSTPTESTPAQEPTTQEECERWCSSRYGAGTPGMFFNIDGCLCRCREGYTTTAEGIVKISIGKCDKLCLDKFGTGSVGIFNSDEMCRCVCSEGYRMNEEKTGCVKITSTQTVKPTNQKQCDKWCSQKYGVGVPGIFFNNACACRCKEGYTGDGVKITLEQCDQKCLDKFGIGHRGVFNSDEMCKFVCSEGYILNEAKTKCIKIAPTPTKKPQTPAPTYNYDDDYTYSEPVPGFEAVFAIAGLLAVAYLMTRRRKK